MLVLRCGKYLQWALWVGRTLADCDFDDRHFMKSVGRELRGMVEFALRRAYPVKEAVSFYPPRPSQNCDFVTNIPTIVFEKYQQEGVCFGLFNAREIADGIFVHIPKSPTVKRVKISGMGELELTLEDDFVNGAIDQLSDNCKFPTTESDNMPTFGLNLLPDWRSYSTTLRMAVCAGSITECIAQIQRRCELFVYGSPITVDILCDAQLLSATAASVLTNNKPKNQSTFAFVNSQLPQNLSVISLTDIGLRPAFTQFSPLHTFSPVFGPSGKPISKEFPITLESIFGIQSENSISPLVLKSENSDFTRFSQLSTATASPTPEDSASSRRLSVLLLQLFDVLQSMPELGPASLCKYALTMQTYCEQSRLTAVQAKATRNVAEKLGRILHCNKQR